MLGFLLFCGNPFRHSDVPECKTLALGCCYSVYEAPLRVIGKQSKSLPYLFPVKEAQALAAAVVEEDAVLSRLDGAACQELFVVKAGAGIGVLPHPVTEAKDELAVSCCLGSNRGLKLRLGKR